MSSYKNYQNSRRKHGASANLSKRGKSSSNARKHFLSKGEMQDRLIDWITFYRRNIHRFVEHYFGLELYLYQRIILYLMNISTTICIVACRAAAKSYIIAIYACARCVLYPNSMVVVASATKKQSKLIVSEKIEKELMPNSPNLAREIKNIRTGNDEIEVVFWNGSSIVVVPASDNARGHRATCMIYEEFRMIPKNIIDSVLSPFLIVRPAPYLKNEKYAHLVEEPMEIYISSAWYKQHWMWDVMKTFTRDMINKGETFLLALDYSITLKHGLRTRRQLLRERKKVDHMSWAMEYENIMVGENANAYYTFDILHKNQTLKKAFYPTNTVDYISNKKNKHKIPKQDGEVRIISADIAMIKGEQNDATAISCMRLLPSKQGYERQVPYIETMEGGHTTKQAIRIKQIFEDFESDYLVLDTQNAGIGIYDELAKVLYDEERDIEYPAWTCFNDEKTAGRITIANAKPVIFSIKAHQQLNHEIAVRMRDTLHKGKIKFLINATEARDYLEVHNKEYINTLSVDEKVMFELPYFQSEFLVNEMVNLAYEISDNTKLIKLIEPKNGRKDRYTSVSYSNFFADLLEKDLLQESESEYDYVFFFN